MKQTWIEQMRSLGGEEDAGLISDHLRTQNEVRLRRGLEPLPDPTRIEGFDDDEPPQRGPSPLERQMMVAQAPPPPPRPAPAPPPSPMVPPPVPPAPARRPAPSPATAPASEPDLLVLDHDASWQGRNVQLSNQDRAAIARIVLQAIEGDIRKELAALNAPQSDAAPKEKRVYRKAKNGRKKKRAAAEKPE